MRTKRTSGKAMMPLLLLVVLAVAAGYNYQRNWSLERSQQGPRPFEGYSSQDLTQLRDAYQQEARAYEQRYESRQQQRVRSSGGELLGERLEQFERIQRNSNALREAGTEVAEREARIREIQKELDYRVVLESGVDLHISRLTSI